MLDHLLQDLRYGVRTLIKNPGLAIVIVLSLALGIGANTAIFSVTSALLLKPLPYPQPDRLAILWLRSPGLGIPQDWPSPGEYMDIKTRNHVFEETALAQGYSATLTGLDQPERVAIIKGTTSLFHLLGARAFIGRLLVPQEDLPGQPVTAVLSYGFWKSKFGGNPNVLNTTLTLNGKQATIVGVLTPSFSLNHEVMPTVGGVEKGDVFMPLPLAPDAVNDRGNENFDVLARMKPGVTQQEAQADVDVIAARIREIDKRDPTFTISVVPLLEQVVGNVRRTVFILFGAVGLVLLIACANVANLLLARASGRQKEIAVRAALGASRLRLVRQMLTESVFLSVLSGAAGLWIAAWSLYAVRTINPGNIPRLDDVGIDGRVLAFTLGISVLTGIVFGLIPALRVSRTDLNAALKAGGRSGTDGGGLHATRDKLRGLLVTVEIALSLMLLVGAGLLVRSFARLQNVSPGFNPDHVISMLVSANGLKYKEDKPIIRFYQDVRDRIRNLPGVISEGAAGELPLTSSISWGGMTVEGYAPPSNEPELQVDQREADENYFQTMKIPLISGRFFSAADTDTSQKVVLIDEKMAKHFWPHGDAVGKRIHPGGPVRGAKNPWHTIVGVVGVVKQYGLDLDTRMVVYYPATQNVSNSMYVVARTSSDPSAVAGSITREIHAIDSDVVVYDISSMDARVSRSLARQRFSMDMLGAFAGFALLLAAIGVYGVMSYLVTQGTRDIGVRIALGAQQSDILRLVIKQGMMLAFIGIIAGLAGAAALSRVMGSLLFGVGSTDFVTFTSVAILLTLIAFAACYIPARRAMRVDPLIALRYE
jgi:putative ABC transport system permease protein